MGTARAYVAALAELATISDSDERRRTWRQGMAALAAAAADRRGAPLEGLDPQALLATVRVALADGLLADMDFLAPAAAAMVTFEVAGGLPPGAERRELGRRALEQLGSGDADTFVALATSLALASRRTLPGAMTRARVAAALSAPLSAGTGADGLALALLASPELERGWIGVPSTGSLPSRRLAARILERAAREAVRRLQVDDDGGMVVLARASVRDAWWRLLADRESLVWRHAAVARGLLAGADPQLADEIDNDLAPDASPTWWRRGATSLAARVEIDPHAAIRCRALLDGELPDRDAGVARAVVGGLGGAFVVEPDVADQLAAQAIERGGLDGVDALVELRRETGADASRAVDAAIAWLDRARATDSRDDDGHSALLAALAGELTGSAAAVGGSLAAHAEAARAALRDGKLLDAMRAATAAADVVAEAVEFLERADPGDDVDRRHEFRTLRELDQELLSDGTVAALLARGEEVARGRVGATVLADLQGRLEAALLSRERDVQVGAVAHRALRLARLRALVRVIDADGAADDAPALRERRLAVVRTLLPRARLEASTLRRAVWAALTRAFDALLRDEHLEPSDLLAGWTTSLDPDEDFAVAREASMVPEMRGALEAYAGAMRAAAGAADPDDRDATIAAVTAAGAFTRALGAMSTPRTDALRASLGRLVRALDQVVRARGQRDVDPALFGEVEQAAAVLGDLVVGARRRLGLPARTPTSPAALHAVAIALERLRRGGTADLAGEAAVAAVAAIEDQIPLVARVLGVALARIAQLPEIAPRVSASMSASNDAITDAGRGGPTEQPALPPWLPASRSMGGFFVMRPLGQGAGGSVFVACRTEDRHDAGVELVALKVPDYDGGSARNLSAQEFEAMFREEAGALLALPRHENLAGFVTFDAGARPKPLLVMELVPGQTLERVLDVGELDTASALRLLDGIAAGLQTMHEARVAHLDLKPANVILRAGTATPVLVDFGLAGRRVRPGCGSPHYGAPEVWTGREGAAPYPVDVYAFACLAFEMLTGNVLVTGEALKDVLASHVGGAAERLAREHLERRAPQLAELLSAALSRRPEGRPSMQRVRAGLAAIAPGIIARPVA